MSGAFSASPTTAVYYGIQTKIQTGGCINPSWRSSVVIPGMSREFPLRSFNFKLRPTKLATGVSSETSFRCNSSSRPGGAGPGENDSRSVLDAFFLGKALAEALSERIESTVGEFLSTVGRLQAEQQKQVLDFQEEVLEKARRAKERAAWEAMEAQGLVSKSSTSNISAVADTAPSEAAAAAAAAAAVDDSRAMPLSSNSMVPNADMYPDSTDEDPRLGVSNDY